VPEAIGAPALPREAETADGLLQRAVDALGFAIVAQERALGEQPADFPAIDERRWTLRERQHARAHGAADPAADRRAVVSALQVLDRSERETWEPQTWQHFRRTEEVLTRLLRDWER